MIEIDFNSFVWAGLIWTLFWAGISFFTGWILNRQIPCEHDFAMDKQIRKIKCRNCGEEHWVDLGVDIYAKDFLKK